MVRSILAALLAACAMVIVCLFLAQWAHWPAPMIAPASASGSMCDTGPTIEQIAPLAQLTTLRVSVADALESQICGKTGSVKAVLLVKGDLTLGVDLKAAVFEQVDNQRRRVVLRLPQPAMEAVSLDTQETKLVGVWESGLWLIAPGGSEADAAAVNKAYGDAQRLVQGSASDSAALQRCRQQTQEIVQSFLAALGWTVEVKWQQY